MNIIKKVLVFLIAISYISSFVSENHSNFASNEFNSSLLELPLLPNLLPITEDDLFYHKISTTSSNAQSINLGGINFVSGDKSLVGKVKKYIPRIIWVAVKSRDEPLPDHFNDMISKNPDWVVKVCDNKCKDDFMDSVFAETSIRALYHLINPIAYASKADIWRYCALYTYGGLYLDDDSFIGTPFSEIVQFEDKMILTEEGPSSLGDCFIPSYHLHDEYAFNKYSHNFTNAMYYTGLDKSNNHAFFHGNTLVNWGIFSMPRHPLLRETLNNIREILIAEYRRRPVLHIAKWDQRWKYVLCGTNFVMTYTLRELMLSNNSESIMAAPRICSRDFQMYSGKAKYISTAKVAGHYMKTMNKDRSINILRYHAPLDIKAAIAYLEGCAVTGESRDIYLIKNGIRRPFGSYDRFLAMNFTDKKVRHVRENILQAMPLGPNVDDDIPSSSKMIPTTNTDVAADIKNKLSHIRSEIDKTNYSCFGDNYGGTRDDFINNVWSKYIGTNLTVMAYPMCFRTFQLGNSIGYFLNDLACSDISGSHFIGISKHFDITGSDPNNKVVPPSVGNPLHLAFFNALPDLLVNPNPLPPEQAKEVMRKECHCLQYCWENNQAPWIKRIPFISKHLRHAIDYYISQVRAATGVAEIKTILNNETDMVYVSKSVLDARQNKDNLVPQDEMMSLDLPLIPDVTIQYRCGDNIGFGKTRYGLLPFRAFTKRIPKSAKLIYIIADSPSRSVYHAYSGRCSIILARLGTYIHTAFPLSKVVIKRGGDLLLDYARIAYSRTSICSASTYCLWPALANQNTVHFPLTPLVARSDTNETAMDLKSPFFHWITDVLLVKEFKQFRPWTKLIEWLEERAE